jgi:hypothetical protein
MNENAGLGVESVTRKRKPRAKPMSPRLMVICLGGLAGAGALVCCDLDEGVETLDADGAPPVETVAEAPDGAEEPAVH